MKRQYLTLAFTFFFCCTAFLLSSQVITRVASTGNWSNPATWTGLGEPSSNTIFIIPAGDTVYVDCNCAEILNSKIELFGTLSFIGGRKIRIDTSGLVNVYESGFVTGVNNGDKLIIGGNDVWTGAQQPIAGPVSCEDLGCYANGVLPVELLDGHFQIDIEEHLLQSEWVTATEKSNEFFIVEYSLDYIEWKEAATVMGAGNSSADRHYQNSVFLDYPDFQKNIYVRLSQVDFNGIRVLLLEESIDTQELIDYDLEPNPASDYIIISGNRNLISALIVTDIQGEYVTRLPLEDGIYRIDIKSILNPGYYFIHVIGKNQEILFSKKQHITTY